MTRQGRGWGKRACHERRRLIKWCRQAASVAGLAVATPAFAGLTSQIFIKWNAQDGTASTATNISQLASTGPLTLAKDNFWQDPARTQGGTALSVADYGVLQSRSFAASIANSTNALTQAYASSLADWSDQVVFSSPLVPFTASGFANVEILIQGGGVGFTGLALGGRLSVDSQARFTLSTASPSPVFDLDMRRACDTSAPCPAPAYTRVNGVDVSSFEDLYVLQFPISFSPFGVTLEGRLSTLASIETDSSAFGTADADFSHSIYWGGITSIVLPDGSTTTNFSAIGASGHDYRLSSIPASVPEPGPGALLAAGLGCVILVRRRARLEAG